MTLKTLLPLERVLFNAPGGSKKKLLATSSTFIAQDAPDLDTQEVFERLMGRERLGSTGIGNGVAIPHARSPLCHTPIAAFLKLAKPIDFDAIDGEPVDLVFVLLVPEEADETHLALLSQVASVLNDAEALTRLRQCSNQHELHASLIEALQRHSSA
ncbi:MAG: PTS transporter subunit EIIA [Halomonadaceae bacterium]|nr:PTS transporter subunit EIIA [Halomonadaceae bacterium]